MSKLLGLACVVAALTLAGAAQGASPTVITQRDTGKTIAIRRGADASLRLSSAWTWTSPRVSTAGVSLLRIDYVVDPGYTEWDVRVIRRGPVTITSVGTPACAPCALASRRFRVTIRGT